MQNRQIRLASRPKGLPVPENWSLVTEEVPQLEDGDVLMKIELISMDPAMRGWMNDRRSYLPPVQIGEVMRAGAGGVVLESRHPDFKPGDHVIGTIGAQEYYLARGGKDNQGGHPAGAVVRTPGRAGHGWVNRLFRPAGSRRFEARRNGGGIGRCRRGRFGCRPDRKNQRMPRGRHCRRAG